MTTSRTRDLKMKKKKPIVKKPTKRAKPANLKAIEEKQAPGLPQDEAKGVEAVPEAGGKIQIIGQFIAARTMATGGIRVSIDIPETLVKDCAIASTLALQRQWAKITVEDYDKTEAKTDTTEQARTKRRPGAPVTG